MFALHTPILIGYAICTVGLILTVRVAANERPPPVPAWFIAVSLLALILLRFPLIFLNAPLNPDEAQFTASAIKFRANMNTWASVDMSTSGPINAFSLMWPFLFGGDTGFAVARITTIVLLSGTWLLMLSALRSTPLSVRAFLAGGLVLFLGGTQEPDFNHYSSETVPDFLLMGATAVALGAVERPARRAMLILAGLCVGLVPFTKLQAGIIAVSLGTILLGQVLWRNPRRNRSALLLVAAACLPACLILVPLTIAGGFPDLWNSYIIFGNNYLVAGWGEMTINDRWPPRLHALARMLSGRLVGGYLDAIALGAVAAGFTLLIRLVRRGSPAWRETLNNPAMHRCIIGVIVLGVATAAVLAPTRPFPHYAFLLLWPATVVAGLIWSLTESVSPMLTRMRAWTLPGAIGVLTVLLIVGLAVEEPRIYYDPDVKGDARVFSAGHLLPEPDSQRGRMLVWGWMPQWYVWSGWTPATRDMQTYNQIWPTPQRDYFRDRLMADLRRDPPEYIIDAVASGSFGFTDPNKDGVSSFPELANFISENYKLLSPKAADASCPRVFARPAMIAAIEAHYVTPSRISASPVREHGTAPASPDLVADNLVFESCPDAWLLPDGVLGEITLELAEMQPIAAVEILNTRGGENGNRATKAARVLAWQGGTLVADVTTQMPRFPYWAVIAIPNTVTAVDRVVVRIESFAGLGGGINEIRLRKR